MLNKKNIFLISLLAFTALSPAFAMEGPDAGEQARLSSSPVFQEIKAFAEMELDSTVHQEVHLPEDRRRIAQEATETLRESFRGDMRKIIEQITRVQKKLNVFANPLPVVAGSETYQQQIKKYFNTESIDGPFKAQLRSVRDTLMEPVPLMRQFMERVEEMKDMHNLSFVSLMLGMSLIGNQYKMQHSLEELFKLGNTELPLVKETREKDTIEEKGMMLRFFSKYLSSDFTNDLHKIFITLDSAFAYLSPHAAEIMSHCELEHTQERKQRSTRISLYWPVGGPRGTKLVLNFNDLFLRERQKIKSLLILANKMQTSKLIGVHPEERGKIRDEIKYAQNFCKEHLRGFCKRLRGWRADFLIDIGTDRGAGASFDDYVSRYYFIKQKQHLLSRIAREEAEHLFQMKEKSIRNKKIRNTLLLSVNTVSSSAQRTAVFETEKDKERGLEAQEKSSSPTISTDEDSSSLSSARISGEREEKSTTPFPLLYSTRSHDEGENEEEGKEGRLEPQENSNFPTEFTYEAGSSPYQTEFSEGEEESIDEGARFKQCHKWLASITHSASCQDGKAAGILHKAYQLAKDLEKHPMLLEEIEQATSEVARRLQDTLKVNPTTQPLASVCYVPKNYEDIFSYFFETPIKYLKDIRFGLVRRLIEGLGGIIDIGRAGSRIHFTLNSQKTSIHLHDSLNGTLDGGRITSLRKFIVDAGFRLAE